MSVVEASHLFLRISRIHSTPVPPNLTDPLRVLPDELGLHDVEPGGAAAFTLVLALAVVEDDREAAKTVA